MAVSAINDFISNTTKHIASYWLFIYILLIILGALIYTAIVVREYYKPEINNENVLAVFAVIYLITIIVLGCIRYIKNILEQKRSNAK